MTPAAWTIVGALTAACLGAFVLLIFWRNRQSSGQKIEHDGGEGGDA